MPNHSQRDPHPTLSNCLFTTALSLPSISVTFCGMRRRINEIATAATAAVVLSFIDRRLSVAVVNNL